MEELLDKPVLPDLVIREKVVRYAGLSFQNFIQSTNSTENLPIPATFLKYSKIAARDIIGGNPEISHIKRRIKSFVKILHQSNLELFQYGKQCQKVLIKEEILKSPTKSTWKNLLLKRKEEFKELKI